MTTTPRKYLGVTSILPDTPEHRLPEVTVLEPEDPRSIINIVPEALRNAILQVPDWFLTMSERELKDSFKARDGWEPGVLDNRLRIAFWSEYTAAQLALRPMVLTSIYAGMCTRTYFYGKCMTDVRRMAWMLCPPTKYAEMVEEALTFGLEELREILAAPVKNAKGQYDAKLAAVKVEIVKMLDMRLKGAIVQKTQNMHLHAHTKAQETPTRDQLADMKEINERLRELEGQAEVGSQTREVIDVPATFLPVPDTE